MSEEEELRDKRKEELARMAEAKKAQEQLKGALRTALDEGAYDRLMNVAVANKELYLIAAKNVIAAYRRAGRKLTEEELLMLLRAIKDQTERKTKITFAHK